MSLGEHLEELRARLILALVGVGVASIVTLYMGRQIVGWLVQPLARELRHLGLPPQTYNLGVTTGFSVYLKVSLVGGLILASPWVIYQLWKFIEAGLYQSERRVVLTVLPFSALMSGLGVLFMYYFMLPVCLAFLIGFAASYPPPAVDSGGGFPLSHWLADVVGSYSGRQVEHLPSTAMPDDQAAGSGQAGVSAPAARLPVLREDPADAVEGQAWIKLPERELRVFFGGRVHAFAPLVGASLVQPWIELGDYIGFVTLLTLGIVIAFQLPVVMLILSWTGVLAPADLSRYRKYCVFGCFVLGSVLTPADPVSMFVLALPLWGLYELGLLLMRLTYRPIEPEPS